MLNKVHDQLTVLATTFAWFSVATYLTAIKCKMLFTQDQHKQEAPRSVRTLLFQYMNRYR